MTKLSFSQLKTYQECSRKFDLHYNKRLRSTEYKSFFAFGSAIDKALNNLLLEKDLQKALQTFDQEFTEVFNNNEKIYLPTYDKVVYAEADFDKDLLESKDLNIINTFCDKNNLHSYDNFGIVKDELDFILEKKEEKGFKNLSKLDHELYALFNWLSLHRKGRIMIQSYFQKVLPKIKEVIMVQGRTKLENSEGDIVDGYLDLIVRWEDNKIYLLDHKTSARPYDSDSAARSQQLISYYHASKDQMKLDGVGFIVMLKNILKNKTKKCSVCGKDGTGQRHKTCDAETQNKRCGGSWIETINPECDIQIILNQVPKPAEKLVLQTFDQANEGIKAQIYVPNLNACGSTESFRCQFYDYCWKGDKSGLIKLEKKK